MKTAEGNVVLVVRIDCAGSQVPSIEAFLARLRGEINVAGLAVEVQLADVPRETEQPAEAVKVEPAAEPQRNRSAKTKKQRSRA